MRFKGKVLKDGKFWYIEVPELDVMTQGYTKKEAFEMIADAIEMLVDKPGFKVEVTPVSKEEFEVGSADTATLVALLLQRRRQAKGLTLAETAKLIGAKSQNAYARYEQGKSMPTVPKLMELLSAVDGHDFVLSRSHS